MLRSLFFAAAVFLRTSGKEPGRHAVCAGIGSSVYGTAAFQRGAFNREGGYNRMLPDADGPGNDSFILQHCCRLRLWSAAACIFKAVCRTEEKGTSIALCIVRTVFCTIFIGCILKFSIWYTRIF